MEITFHMSGLLHFFVLFGTTAYACGLLFLLVILPHYSSDIIVIGFSISVAVSLLGVYVYGV